MLDKSALDPIVSLNLDPRDGSYVNIIRSEEISYSNFSYPFHLHTQHLKIAARGFEIMYQ